MDFGELRSAVHSESPRALVGLLLGAPLFDEQADYVYGAIAPSADRSTCVPGPFEVIIEQIRNGDYAISVPEREYRLVIRGSESEVRGPLSAGRWFDHLEPLVGFEATSGHGLNCVDTSGWWPVVHLTWYDAAGRHRSLLFLASELRRL
jgi:hypothetical protein